MGAKCMKKGSLIKSTVIVMVVAVISRCIGLVRDQLITYKFGATVYTDAYKLSASIPDIIFTIIGLAISTTFVPMLSRVKVKHGKKEMYKFANNIINILFCISFVIFIVSMMFPKAIVYALAKNANVETINVATDLTRILLINLVFLCINACFTAILQVNEDFVIPSILGLFYNIPIILYLLLAKDFNVYGLTYANVLGNFFKVAVQIPPLYKNGYKYEFFINFKDERVRKILILIIPVIVSAGANSLNLVVDKNIASGIGVGAITALDCSQLLVNFINAIISTSIISSVVYPVLSNRISEGDKEGFLEVLTKTVVYLALLLIPVTAGMLIYGEDVMKLIFGHGNFTDRDVSLAASAFAGYTLGFFFTGLRDILNSTLFSMGKTKITAINGVIGVAINIVLSIILSKEIGIMGVSLASSIAMVVTSILLIRSIIKLEGKINIKLILIKVAKIIMAAFIMSIIVVLINVITGSLNYIVTLVIGGIVGAVIYFILVYIFKIEEVSEIIGFTLKKALRRP